ncbi:hypothetical protein H6F43_21580 [Leptolyngbya sp. FACHB-36]|uniref:DALR anticodon-binding domain-containing protein n=1 Tax=Leptolyngbya sp. FACHB-36 TaxID=2692808 RepID=UPI0016807503|nr:DALR anticodon-binding domain-containing protein [Leptolyngbya sp. FACHB-36]MBD2022778.1 hypothetical protein [Leptolyngbya sp. FACHB-36]
MNGNSNNKVELGSEPLPLLQPNSVTLKRIQDGSKLLYSSAIAHQLAAHSADSAVAIATEIVQSWQQPDMALCLPLPAVVLFDLTIQVTPKGFILIDVGDRAIAAWLDTLLTSSFPSFSFPAAFLPSLFPAQHAYARCCSLLRLVNDTGRVAIRPLSAHPSQWQIVQPSGIPWLNGSQLRLNHPTERQLLCQLLGAIDDLTRNQRQLSESVVRLVNDIANAFQEFHRSRQPLGSMDSLMQAQAGLLLATQRVLHWLLEDGLGVHAPSEL